MKEITELLKEEIDMLFTNATNKLEKWINTVCIVGSEVTMMLFLFAALCSRTQYNTITSTLAFVSFIITVLAVSILIKYNNKLLSKEEEV
jgi:hypothetical protein